MEDRIHGSTIGKQLIEKAIFTIIELKKPSRGNKHED